MRGLRPVGQGVSIGWLDDDGALNAPRPGGPSAKNAHRAGFPNTHQE